jgi:hypothetical protein
MNQQEVLIEAIDRWGLHAFASQPQGGRVQDFVMYCIFTLWCSLVDGYLWLRSQWKKGKVKIMPTKGTSDTPAYSFCETVTAGSSSKWHIRLLTRFGKKLGGGADTPSLCGRKVAWDLSVELTPFHLEHNSCKTCLAEYERRNS